MYIIYTYIVYIHNIHIHVHTHTCTYILEFCAHVQIEAAAILGAIFLIASASTLGDCTSGIHGEISKLHGNQPSSSYSAQRPRSGKYESTFHSAVACQAQDALDSASSDDMGIDIAGSTKLPRRDNCTPIYMPDRPAACSPQQQSPKLELTLRRLLQGARHLKAFGCRSYSMYGVELRI